MRLRGGLRDAWTPAELRIVDGLCDRYQLLTDDSQPVTAEQWIAEQRRAYGAGQMTGLRAERLEKLGMVWSLADERFQENLEAAKAYFEEWLRM
ncbi:helicase associated domain-containing protein [Streptomyces sp. H27-D2]|uniref:helicase associated domain-containing protein n=1 Tax=Streptomyces sp. H27-D2 TaxID=3046304 RepID=UPI003FA711D4